MISHAQEATSKNSGCGRWLIVPTGGTAIFRASVFGDAIVDAADLDAVREDLGSILQ